MFIQYIYKANPIFYNTCKCKKMNQHKDQIKLIQILRMVIRYGRILFNRERFTVFTENLSQSLTDGQVHILTGQVLKWLVRRKVHKLLAQAEIYESAPDTICCRIKKRLSSLNRKLTFCDLDRIDLELDFVGHTIFINTFLHQQWNCTVWTIQFGHSQW